eukprot:m.442952 g.442952  ORF g.442952 m.442952 type:complete len:243 (+) comp21478_c1_seq2:163-891(+)
MTLWARWMCGRVGWLAFLLLSMQEMAAATNWPVAADGQPLPASPPGFSYTGSPASRVHLEVFGDNLCSWTKAAWPVIQQLAQTYDANALEIRMHFFPLPYHHNAFFVAEADRYIGTTAFGGKVGARLFPFVEAIFAQQETLLTQAENLTEAQVQNRICDIAASVGVPAANLTAAFANRTMNLATRAMFKYACSRGVTYTPAFYLNGFEINPAPTNLSAWGAYINPLIAATASVASQQRCTHE